jgi:hypothetical protein
MLKFCCWHPGCCWPRLVSIYLAWPIPSVVEQGRDSGITGPGHKEKNGQGNFTERFRDL